MTLARKTPMRRTAFKRKEPKPFALPDRQQFERNQEAKGRVSRKKAATAAEKRHMDSVVRLGCIACRNLGMGETPCEIHHVRFLAGAGQRASHMDVLGLCPNHHRLGGYGVAFHAGPEVWQQTYGPEADLLAQTKRETGVEQGEREVA
ncbi:UNVERIFIED_ORG: hypothetical protein ABIC54_004461 [Burkholderia sp. 1263]